MMPPPVALHWLFWDVEIAQLDVEAHSDYILGRVLERGTLDDVTWALRTYGEDRIRDFFRAQPRPELTPRTLAFWRALLREDQAWPTQAAFRRPSSTPWHG
jgi:hypothetical protein